MSLNGHPTYKAPCVLAEWWLQARPIDELDFCPAPFTKPFAAP